MRPGVVFDLLLDTPSKRNYGNNMKTRVIRIGNSRGVRLPAALLEAYRLREGG